MTTGILTLIIVAAILAQVAVALLLGLYRRRQQYRELGQHRENEERVAPPASSGLSAVTSVPSAPAWEGFREFTVQRREFEDSNREICSFYLAPLDGKPLPAFRPGQFLTFKLSLEDTQTSQPKSVVRCYSLSDAPRNDNYRISVKRVPAPADRPELPPGLSSNFFHDRVQPGSRLLVRAPSGHFHMMEEELLPMVLIAGGIGITPMLSMLNSVLQHGPDREVWLFYGVRNGDEQMMKGPLQALARTHENFHLHVCYSAPREGESEGDDYQHRGRVDLALLRATLKMMRYQFYVCGPRAMMESIVPGLEEWGVPSGDIYYESFGPATLIKHEKAVVEETGAQPISVLFSRSGKSIPWDPGAASLLAFAEANGVEVESGCRAGSCGACQTAVQGGEVDYTQAPDVDVAAGHCLLCISVPKSDLTLEA